MNYCLGWNNVVRYWVKTGFLNYSEASEIVVNVLSNPAMLPISIGVFGSWGTGKSTILNLIEQKLQAEKKRRLYPY